MERCDPNGEQDGGRWKNCPDKKKAPPCGGKAFLNEKKNCGRAGGPSLWRAVEHRWVIFVCALLNIKIKKTGYEPFLRSE